MTDRDVRQTERCRVSRSEEQSARHRCSGARALDQPQAEQPLPDLNQLILITEGHRLASTPTSRTGLRAHFSIRLPLRPCVWQGDPTPRNHTQTAMSNATPRCLWWCAAGKGHRNKGTLRAGPSCPRTHKGNRHCKTATEPVRMHRSACLCGSLGPPGRRESRSSTRANLR